MKRYVIISVIHTLHSACLTIINTVCVPLLHCAYIGQFVLISILGKKRNLRLIWNVIQCHWSVVVCITQCENKERIQIHHGLRESFIYASKVRPWKLLIILPKHRQLIDESSNSCWYIIRAYREASIRHFEIVGLNWQLT